MNWRLFFIVMAVLVLGIVNGVLLYGEDIVTPDTKSVAESRRADPLFSNRFSPALRETNLGDMGFAPEEIKEILKKISVLEERYHTNDPSQNLVIVRTDATSDPDALITAFCGTGSTVPVRYAAIPYLVAVKGTQLKVVDLQEISSIEFQEDWAKAARIQAVYEEADLNADRKTDAVRMVLAAILERQEQLLLDHKSPWGRGAFSGWDWGAVQKKFPGVKQRVFDYTALMHLVLEGASGEQGICAHPEGSGAL